MHACVCGHWSIDRSEDVLIVEDDRRYRNEICR